MVSRPSGRKETMAPYRVLPVPDELTEPYWEATRRGALAIQQCGSCLRFQHPPVYFCTDCHDEDAELAFADVSGRGAIYSYYIHEDSDIRAFGEKTPYPVVMVELEEQPGLFVLANLLDCDFAEITAGMPVEVVFERASEEIVFPQFRPARAGSAG